MRLLAAVVLKLACRKYVLLNSINSDKQRSTPAVGVTAVAKVVIGSQVCVVDASDDQPGDGQGRAGQGRAGQGRAGQSSRHTMEDLRRRFWPQKLASALQRQAQASLKAAGKRQEEASS
ncbi:MAG: hypothetical protein FRX49_09572 [Trebouxia sp. A1-2]|nr:MAG: hypothetical protein FRX49_09572 [Trebouxia sp. A1-2]